MWGVGGGCRSQETLEPLELELQAVVSSSMWELHLEKPGKNRTPNLSAVSLAPGLKFVLLINLLPYLLIDSLCVCTNVSWHTWEDQDSCRRWLFLLTCELFLAVPPA